MQHVWFERSRPLKLGLLVALALAAAAVGALIWSQQVSAGPATDRTTGKVAVVPAATPGIQFHGGINRWVGINRTDNASTTSTSFVDIPGMSVTFQTTQVHQRVLIMFQAEWFNHDRALVRALVDGVVVSGPGDGGSPMAVNSGDDAGNDVDMTNGFNFISDDVTHGVHTVTLQYASNTGSEIFADERSLIVQFQS